MNYRMNTLLARKTFTSDTTEIIDIKVTDPISELVIGLEASHSSANQTAHPCACLTKIELVDGSNVLFSLDGYELESRDWYMNGGKFKSNYNYALNGGSECRYMGYKFGRWLWDNEYAFDPVKFTNPQLRITMDIDAGGNAADTLYITVWANLFDEKTISAKGFLSCREIKEYSISSSVHEYTDMPLDAPYRAIYFRPFVAGTEPNQLVSNLKLTEDQDKRVPFDHGVQDIERAINSMYPDVEEHYYFSVTTASRNLFVAPTTRVVATGSVWAAAAADVYYAFYDGDGGRLKCITGGASANSQIYVRGRVPHAVYQIPFGMLDDPADYYDVRRLGNLKLDITGAGTATGFICVDQLRSY